MSAPPSNPSTPLSSHGLEPSGKVHWNLGWEELHGIAVDRGEATLTSHSVLLATTGERTGRSPNDRFIVNESGMADDVWWGDVNRPIPASSFDKLLKKTRDHLDKADKYSSRMLSAARIQDTGCQSD